MRRISFTVSNEIYDRLLVDAAKEGCPVSWVIRDHLETVLRRRELNNERVKRYRALHGITESDTDSSSKVVIFSPEAFEVSTEVLKAFNRAFPAVDVATEIRRAHAWIIANPKNRKSNYHRYLVNWLSKAQDRAPRVVTNVEPLKIRPAVLTEPDGPITPMPAEIREKMRRIIEGVKMP